MKKKQENKVKNILKHLEKVEHIYYSLDEDVKQELFLTFHGGTLDHLRQMVRNLTNLISGDK